MSPLTDGLLGASVTAGTEGRCDSWLLGVAGREEFMASANFLSSAPVGCFSPKTTTPFGCFSSIILNSPLRMNVEPFTGLRSWSRLLELRSCKGKQLGWSLSRCAPGPQGVSLKGFTGLSQHIFGASLTSSIYPGWGPRHLSTRESRAAMLAAM